MDAERRALNDLVLENEGDLFDGVVDLTNHAALDDPSGPLYLDGLHLLPRGHTAVADVARPVLLALLGR
jgi:hypothetical protein